jgi:hypothetical protein
VERLRIREELMTMPPTLERPYVVGSGLVTLSAKTGDGQHGVHIVWLDGKEVTRKSLGDFTDLPIGPGDQLVGRKLEIKSEISAVNASTTKVDVTYILQGGPAEAQSEQSHTVTAPGKAMIFYAQYSFISAPAAGQGGGHV